MLSESLSGIATIRANGSLEYFKKKFRVLHDVSQLICKNALFKTYTHCDLTHIFPFPGARQSFFCIYIMQQVARI